MSEANNSGQQHPRAAQVARVTRETRIQVSLRLDGRGSCRANLGLPFLEHMLDALCRHGGFDLEMRCDGDLEVDDHHSVEDCALTLGQAFDEALGERRGVTRFGSAYAPLDEALCRCVVDLSGRPFSRVRLGLRRERLGNLSTENLPHFFRSLATAARLTLHMEMLSGENDHHRAEAAFKALALALGQAVALRDGAAIPSTKGTLGSPPASEASS